MRQKSEAFVILACRYPPSSVAFSGTFDDRSHLFETPDGHVSRVLSPQILTEQLKRQPAIVAHLFQQPNHSTQVEVAVPWHDAVFVVLLGTGWQGRSIVEVADGNPFAGQLQ